MIQVFLRGGPVMWPILLCSVFAMAIVIEKIAHLSFIKMDSREFLSGVMQKIKRHQIKEALEECDKAPEGKGLSARVLLALKVIKLQPGPIPNIIKAGVLKYDQPREKIKEAIEDASLYEVPKLEKNLSVLATLAHISPLLGLLGTVTGMVRCFQTVQLKAASFHPVSPGDLAGGIWEALITTVAGLIVAIPVYVAYNYLVNRVNSFILEMEKSATELVNFLSE